jgi:hypothetical protein
MGFFVRSRLREDPVGSYPAFSPLPNTILAGRSIFCDTVRYSGFASWVPLFSQGMPPSGVRTFLWRENFKPAIVYHFLRLAWSSIEIQQDTEEAIDIFG